MIHTNTHTHARARAHTHTHTHTHTHRCVGEVAFADEREAVFGSLTPTSFCKGLYLNPKP